MNHQVSKRQQLKNSPKLTVSHNFSVKVASLGFVIAFLGACSRTAGGNGNCVTATFGSQLSTKSLAQAGGVLKMRLFDISSGETLERYCNTTVVGDRGSGQQYAVTGTHCFENRVPLEAQLNLYSGTHYEEHPVQLPDSPLVQLSRMAETVEKSELPRKGFLNYNKELQSGACKEAGEQVSGENKNQACFEFQDLVALPLSGATTAVATDLPEGIGELYTSRMESALLSLADASLSSFCSNPVALQFECTLETQLATITPLQRALAFSLAPLFDRNVNSASDLSDDDVREVLNLQSIQELAREKQQKISAIEQALFLKVVDNLGTDEPVYLSVNGEQSGSRGGPLQFTGLETGLTMTSSGYSESSTGFKLQIDQVNRAVFVDLVNNDESLLNLGFSDSGAALLSQSALLGILTRIGDDRVRGRHAVVFPKAKTPSELEEELARQREAEGNPNVAGNPQSPGTAAMPSLPDDSSSQVQPAELPSVESRVDTTSSKGATTSEDPDVVETRESFGAEQALDDGGRNAELDTAMASESDEPEGTFRDSSANQVARQGRVNCY